MRTVTRPTEINVANVYLYTERVYLIRLFLNYGIWINLFKQDAGVGSRYSERMSHDINFTKSLKLG